MKSASYRSASFTWSLADLSQRLAIGFDARAHGDGELQVRDGPRALACAGAGEGQPEVRVVVDRIELYGLGELPASPSRPAGKVERTAERLPDRSLVRFEEFGLSEQHGGLVRMAVLEEMAGPLQELVGSWRPVLVQLVRLVNAHTRMPL